MIIVSQNRDVIVNFERVNYIGTAKECEGEWAIEVNYDDFNPAILATYKTEKRAKEVLQEIMDTYKDCNCERYIGYGYVRNEVYEMPEE